MTAPQSREAAGSREEQLLQTLRSALYHLRDTRSGSVAKAIAVIEAQVGSGGVLPPAGVVVASPTDEQILDVAEANGLVCQEAKHARDRVVMTPAGRAVIATVRAVLESGPARAPSVPEGYQLVMVPKIQPADEPDWDECIRQAEVATGLRVERHTLSIVIREVRRWLAGRSAAPLVRTTSSVVRLDEQYRRALAIVIDAGRASVSMVQRKMSIRYSEAQELVARMVRDGFVSIADAPGLPADLAAQAAPRLEVWFGSMPESNGKKNWTAILHKGDISEGFTIQRSEYHDRVRYEADCVRFLIGELDERPFIVHYNPNMLSPGEPSEKGADRA